MEETDPFEKLNLPPVTDFDEWEVGQGFWRSFRRNLTVEGFVLGWAAAVAAMGIAYLVLR